MTDLHNRQLSDVQLDAIAALDVNLGSDASINESAELRRQLAASELRAIKAAQREDFAQFTLETAQLRADRAEAALKQQFMERLTAEVPERLENSVEGLAEALIDDIAAGTLLDELDVSGHIESWMDERRG
jgi:hypothetical protein